MHAAGEELVVELQALLLAFLTRFSGHLNLAKRDSSSRFGS
jgi:hypothetical protein